jgi:hypothetical protein
MSGHVKSYNNVLEITPTVSASSAYTAEDQVGGIQTLDAACQSQGSGATLVSLVVTDKGKQNAALSVFFFDELPTVASVDNGAITITDAEMADKCIGVVSLAAASYVEVAGNSVVTAPASSTGLYLKSRDANGKLYAVVKTTGTPTYASTSDLVFKYSFIQD